MNNQDKKQTSDFAINERLAKLKEQFNIPNEIVEIVRDEMVKG